LNYIYIDHFRAF